MLSPIHQNSLHFRRFLLLILTHEQLQDGSLRPEALGFFTRPFERANTNAEEMPADLVNPSMLIEPPANAAFTALFLLTAIWERFAGGNPMPLPR